VERSRQGEGGHETGPPPATMQVLSLTTAENPGELLLLLLLGSSANVDGMMKSTA